MATVKTLDPLNVGTRHVDDVVAVVPLPPGTVLLINGDRLLDCSYQAVTISRANIRWAASIFGFEAHLNVPWDCGISISITWAQRQRGLPGYFAYLLGHELGHATTVLSDPELNCFEDLLVASIRHVTSREWRWADLPHERRYDQFGMAVAERLFGRAQIERDFRRVIDEQLTDNVRRIRDALLLEPRLDLEGLREDLAAFSAPYRGPLLTLWRRVKSGRTPGVTASIDRLESLWDMRTA